MRRLVALDFVAPRHRFSLIGCLLLGLGGVAVASVALEYRALSVNLAGLELRKASRLRAAAPPVDRAAAASDTRAAVSAEQAAIDLATPWTLLLSELEQASKEVQGQVALLGVEPDHTKHLVRITAEARSLALAIAYVERLKDVRSIQFPMLDRHEVRGEDAERPVRFELTGVWRDNL